MELLFADRMEFANQTLKTIEETELTETIVVPSEISFQEIMIVLSCRNSCRAYKHYIQVMGGLRKLQKIKL